MGVPLKNTFMGECGYFGLFKAHSWVGVPFEKLFMDRYNCLKDISGQVYLSEKHLWMGVTN